MYHPFSLSGIYIYLRLRRLQIVDAILLSFGVGAFVVDSQSAWNRPLGVPHNKTPATYMNSITHMWHQEWKRSDCEIQRASCKSQQNADVGVSSASQTLMIIPLLCLELAQRVVCAPPTIKYVATNNNTRIKLPSSLNVVCNDVSSCT